MKSVGLARRAAAFSASAAVLAAMVTGLVSSPAQAATPAAAGKAVQAAAAGQAGHKPKVSITTPKASPGDYQGACPVKVNLSSTIKVPVKGKTELAYRWLHGDGSKGKVKVVKLKGHGNKYVKVKESLTFNGDVKGWEAVQVLGPRKAVSKKGYFSVSCDNGDHGDDNIRVWARAWADPDSYVGPCTPGDKIDFGGVIKVNRPTWVKYRWVLNGDVVDGGTIKVWDSRRVDLGYSPRQSQRGWAQLVIVGPDEGASNRAYYKVWCKDETPHVKVSATDLVTGTNHDGCKVGANANINSTGPARVKYVWSVNGTPVAKDEAVFSGAGTKNVVLADQVLAGDAKNGGKITLSVYGPDNSDSITQSYAACVAKASVSAVSVVGQRNDMCKDTRGPGVDFQATLHTTASATVKYHWVVNGKQDGPQLERKVDGDMVVTWGIGGTHGASETSGSIELVIDGPNSASSGATSFVKTCPPAA
ncbi:hypothetical protein [Nonomuraea sediminis]|uniref:hypothetical protein n=1 Tax=Nonomuraea sediminis TaxID=2835864 RepID=UPI001BDDA281|nr:hypothetical protein [Nonomuraea sediminis]